jgi:hypothetical protein
MLNNISHSTQNVNFIELLFDKHSNQESILPNFIFLCFPIFALKLSQFTIKVNNAIPFKQPSLKAKNRKISVLERKKFDRIVSLV